MSSTTRAMYILLLFMTTSYCMSSLIPSLEEEFNIASPLEIENMPNPLNASDKPEFSLFNLSATMAKIPAKAASSLAQLHEKSSVTQKTGMKTKNVPRSQASKQQKKSWDTCRYRCQTCNFGSDNRGNMNQHEASEKHLVATGQADIWHIYTEEMIANRITK